MDNRLKLYQGNDELEAAQLRSVLLFSEFGQSNKRTDLMAKLLYSFIIKEKGEATLESLTSLFNHQFKANRKPAQFKSYIDGLIAKGMITRNGDKLVALSEQEKGTIFFDQLEKDTKSLIDGIINRYITLQKSNHLNNRAVIERNITKALSAYFKLASLSIVNSPELPSVNDSIKYVIEDLQQADGERLISAIGKTIQNPTNLERKVLNEWAKAYLLTQILKIDPELVNFKMTLINQKSFVLDTDIVLNLLATHARFSCYYRTLIAKLIEIGCDIYVPQDVVQEVIGHANQACNIVRTYGTKQIDNYTSYELEGPQSNVFIEDYVKLRREKKEYQAMTFETYIRNFYIKGRPSVLQEKLRGVIGKNIDNTLKEVQLDDETKEKLKEVINEKTSDSMRGVFRKNEVNKSLSETDARMYLTLKEYNEEPKNKGLLRYKFYFLTQSTRTIRAAKDMGIYDFDIICHPEALALVLTEIGQISQDEVSLVNLFENPFLAHAAMAVWDRIEPVLKAGFQVNFMELEQLRTDVDMRFDEFLLSSNPEERIAYSKEYRKLGYTFASQIAELADENQQLKYANIKLKLENQSQLEMNINLNKKNEKLRIEQGKKKYLKRLGKIKNKNGKRKRK